MLKPEEILSLSEGAEHIASMLRDGIVSRLVEAILDRLSNEEDYILTARDAWLIATLKSAGILMEKLQEDIARLTKLQLEEIKDAFEAAGVKSFNYDTRIYQQAGLLPVETAEEIIEPSDVGYELDGILGEYADDAISGRKLPETLTQSPYYVRLMQRNYNATGGEWKNFCQTTAEEAQKLFISECDKAYNLVSTGAVSYTEAVKDAVGVAIRDGGKIKYPTGHEDALEVATLRCVRTGMSQACAQITLERMKEKNVDLVLTSAHLGARLTHEPWQGKVFSVNMEQIKQIDSVPVSKREKKPRFQPVKYAIQKLLGKKQYPDFVESCGYGLVDGICGANCRHSFGPYFEGMNNPFEDYGSERNLKAYQLQQKQRYLERRIRNQKREVMGLKTALSNAPEEMKPAFELDYQKEAARLQKYNRAYNDFCEKSNLKHLQDRLNVAKWDRKQAASASGAARKYNNKK